MAKPLTVNILSKFNDRGVNQAERSVGGLSKLGGKIAGLAATVGGVGAAAAGAWKVLSAGSDLQQSIGAIESTFGKATGTISDFGKQAATTIGVSNSKFNELAAVSGSMLKNLGYNSAEAADATKDLAVRSADLAATFGGNTADAMDAMNAALRGEFDSLEKYGVKLSQTAVQQKAVEMGLADATGEVDAHAQAQAALALIMEQSEDKAGTFADETGTMAGSLQILKARFTDIMARLGTAFLPLVERLTAAIGTYLMPAIEAFAGWLGQLGTAFSGATTGGGPFADVMDRLRSVFATLQPIITNIASYIADLAGRIANDLQPTIQALAAFVVEHVLPGFERLAQTFYEKVWPGIRKLIDALEPLFQLLYSKVYPIVLKLAGPAFDALILALQAAFTIIGSLLTVIAQLITWATQLAQVIGSVLSGAFNAVMAPINAVVSAIQRVIDMAQRAISAVKSIPSPGGIVHKVGGFLGGLFDEPDPFGISSATVKLLPAAPPSSSRMARALGAGPTTRAGGLRSVDRARLVVNGQLMPQETARQLAQLMNGARVRTGFVGVRP